MSSHQIRYRHSRDLWPCAIHLEVEDDQCRTGTVSAWHVWNRM